MVNVEIGKVIQCPSGIEWVIEDFFSLLKEKKSYQSPWITLVGKLWYLDISPNAFQWGKIEYITVWIGSGTSGPPTCFECSLSLKTKHGDKYGEHHLTRVFEDSRKGVSVPLLPMSELKIRKSDLVPEGVLTVVFCLKLVESVERIDNEKKLESSTLPQMNKILQDLKALYVNQEDCDVIIKVKEQEFPAHSLILKARSPVFAAALRTDMKEKATGVIHIKDLDPSTFSDFLCFLYCEEVNLSTVNVFDLFITADKYDILDLRTKCIEFMKENLSVDTFCDTITLALRHSETELIHLATEYFIKNAARIITTVKWQTFLAENPTQSNELFIKFATSGKDSNE